VYNNARWSTVANEGCLPSYLLHGTQSLSYSKNFPTIYGPPEVKFHVHSSHPLVPILRQFNPVHITLFYFSNNHLNILQLNLSLDIGIFSGFPTKTLRALFSFPIHATCPADLILLDFAILIILGGEFKL
jgi:hypothetical protein